MRQYFRPRGGGSAEELPNEACLLYTIIFGVYLEAPWDQSSSWCFSLLVKSALLGKKVETYLTGGGVS